MKNRGREAGGCNSHLEKRRELPAEILFRYKMERGRGRETGGAKGGKTGQVNPQVFYNLGKKETAKKAARHFDRTTRRGGRQHGGKREDLSTHRQQLRKHR